MKIDQPRSIMSLLLFTLLALLAAPVDAAQPSPWTFAAGSYPGDSHIDLYALKGQFTHQGRMVGSDEYQFLLADANDDNHPDLYAIRLAGAPSLRQERTLLDGASDYCLLFRTGRKPSAQRIRAEGFLVCR
jgi:hypothetical protein